MRSISNAIRTDWSAQVNSWLKEHSPTKSFEEAEQALLGLRGRLGEVDIEPELTQVFTQLASSLQPQQPLGGKTAWAVWPLLRSQDEKIRYLACTVLRQHHQNLAVRLADEQEHPMSSVLLTGLLGVKHPEALDFTSVTSGGLEALYKVWEGIPLSQIIAEDPKGKQLSELVQAASFFECEEVLESQRLFESIRAAYACTANVVRGYGKHVVLESRLSSEGETEEVVRLSRLFLVAGFSLEHHFSVESPHSFQHFERLLCGDERGLVTDMSIGGQVGEEGIVRIASLLQNNQTLEQLDLYGNHVGFEGIKALAAALEANTTLQVLDLQKCSIDDEGAQILAALLKKNPALQELDLSYNFIGKQGKHILKEALKENSSLQGLDLDYNRPRRIM